jgi:hypothetical protein
MVLAVAASAVTFFGQAAPAAAPASAPSMPAPSTITSLDEPIATINGRPVNNRVFYSIMMQVAGVRVFRQIFDLTLVQGACADAGVPLSGDDFGKRLDKELDKMMDAMGLDPKMKRDERINVLYQVLSQRGVTIVEFRLNEETNALLRALSEGRVQQPTDDEVKEAWQSQYGEQRKIRVILYDPAKTSVPKIKEIIQSAKTPEDAANEFRNAKVDVSIQAYPGIPKNAKADDTFKNIMKVTFETLKAPKDVSQDIVVTPPNGPQQHVVVVLDEVIPDRTTKPENKFDTVKDDVKKAVFDAKQTQWMQQHLAFLQSKAVVEFKDPTLQQINENVIRAATQSAAAQVNGTAPAAAPATSAPATSAPAATRPVLRP